MPKKANPENPFDQNQYVADWKKKNMRSVSAQYKADFVAEFKEACAKLGIKQSDVIRQAMTDTIEKAKEE